MKWFLAFCCIFMLASPLAAAPDLGHFRDIGGVRIYPDHRRGDIWYLTPAMPQLQLNEDLSPAYSFDLFRYYGRQATGDQKTFWAHGVLALTVNRERPAEQLNLVRNALKKMGIRRPKLRSMPIAEANIRLLFAAQSQELHQGSRWSGGHFVLPLDSENSQLLSQAIDQGHLQVSLVVEEQLNGVTKGVKTESSWKKASVANGWTLPIELDQKRFPEHFRRTDLSGRMVRGYTGLDIFCFDFLENLVPDLYAKIVEVAIPTEGRDLVETRTFYEADDYRSRIDFELARDLDQPYQVRITKVFKDGRREVGNWQQKQGDSLLDITAYRSDSRQSDSTDDLDADLNEQEDSNDDN